MTQPENLPAVIDQFVTAVTPTRRTQRVTEDDAYVAMLWRMVRSLLHRAVDRPELLAQIGALGSRCGEIQNMAVAVNAELFAADPARGWSVGEISRSLGISRQAASQRRARGVALIQQHLDAIDAGTSAAAMERRRIAAITAGPEVPDVPR